MFHRQTNERAVVVGALCLESFIDLLLISELTKCNFNWSKLLQSEKVRSHAKTQRRRVETARYLRLPFGGGYKTHAAEKIYWESRGSQMMLWLFCCSSSLFGLFIIVIPPISLNLFIFCTLCWATYHYQLREIFAYHSGPCRNKTLFVCYFENKLDGKTNLYFFQAKCDEYSQVNFITFFL